MAAVALLLAAGAGAAWANGLESWWAGMTGLQETPAVSTVASADFQAQVSADGNSGSYTLTYKELEGIVTQSHIHFGAKNTNGGISVCLCSTLTSLPTPAG